MHDDNYWMSQAYDLALQAQVIDEVPVGAIVVKDQQIIGQGYNQCISACDPSAHAEMIAVREAAKNIGNYRLLGCRLYVTLEPCCMCAALLVHARVERLVFAAADPKAGACGSVFNLTTGFPLNHSLDVISDVMHSECSLMLKDFFKNKRLQNKSKN